MAEKRNIECHVRSSKAETKIFMLPVTPVAIENLAGILYPGPSRSSDLNVNTYNEPSKNSAIRSILRSKYRKPVDNISEYNQQNLSSNFNSGDRIAIADRPEDPPNNIDKTGHASSETTFYDVVVGRSPEYQSEFHHGLGGTLDPKGEDFRLGKDHNIQANREFKTKSSYYNSLTSPIGPTDDQNHRINNFQKYQVDPHVYSENISGEKSEAWSPHRKSTDHSKNANNGTYFFHKFVKECCENVKPDYKYVAMVSRHDMYERYKAWCDDRGHHQIGGNIFMELADNIFTRYRYKKKEYYTEVRLR